MKYGLDNVYSSAFTMKKISVMKMQERHTILERFIGYLDKEQEALDMGYWLLTTAFILMGIGTFLEMIFFWLYNGLLHPFANILKDDTNPEDENKCKISSNSSILL